MQCKSINADVTVVAVKNSHYTVFASAKRQLTVLEVAEATVSGCILETMWTYEQH